MKNIDTIKTIDVTLRDGGYRNNFSFSMDYVLEHARFIQESRIDYIEIGYRNGSVIQYENQGVTGYTKNKYIKDLNLIRIDIWN